MIYRTNIIESVHRQFRTLTKTKGAFPNDNSLLKLLYAGILNAEKKWSMPIRNWSLTISQLNIHFKERFKSAFAPVNSSTPLAFSLFENTHLLKES